MFPATHLSVIMRVRAADAGTRRAAFDDLTRAYWRPSYRYLRLHWRLDAADAEDAVQGFFCAAFEKDYLTRFDPAKARFRTFLRVCLDRFVQNLRASARAARRGGADVTMSLDFASAEAEIAGLPAVPGDAERFFHDETIREIFTRAVDRARAACARAGRLRAFAVFERHDVHPDASTSYGSIADEHRLTVAQVTNDLHFARRVFREAALAELRDVCATDEEFEAEARALFGADLRS